MAWQVLCEVIAGVDGDVIASLLRDALEAYAAGDDEHRPNGGEERTDEAKASQRCVVAAVVVAHVRCRDPFFRARLRGLDKLIVPRWCDFFSGLPNKHPLHVYTSYLEKCTVYEKAIERFVAPTYLEFAFLCFSSPCASVRAINLRVGMDG